MVTYLVLLSLYVMEITVICSDCSLQVFTWFLKIYKRVKLQDDMRGHIKGVIKESCLLPKLRVKNSRGFGELLIVEGHILSIEIVVLEVDGHQRRVLAASHHLTNDRCRHSLPVIAILNLPVIALAARHTRGQCPFFSARLCLTMPCSPSPPLSPLLL